MIFEGGSGSVKDESKEVGFRERQHSEVLQNFIVFDLQLPTFIAFIQKVEIDIVKAGGGQANGDIVARETVEIQNELIKVIGRGSNIP